MGNQEQNKPVSFLLLEEDLRRDIFMTGSRTMKPSRQNMTSVPATDSAATLYAGHWAIW